MIKKPRRVAPAFRHIKKSIDPIIEIVNKGIGVNSDTVIFERMPDGRVKPRLHPTIAAQFGGGGVSTALSSPPPTGACCIAGVCSVLSEADCIAAGGTYQGDGTTCDPDPCGGGGSLPDTFYVSFRIRFNADEAGGGGYPFVFNISGDYSTSKAFELGLYYTGDPSVYDVINTQFYFGDNTYTEFTGLDIEQDTYYVWDLKVELSGDHKTQTMTVRLDGSTLGTASNTSPAAWDIANFGLGAMANFGQTNNRDVDWFKIGTATWGDSDLFDAEFGTDESPFDSLVGAGASVASGALHCESTDENAYALKTF
jgi:hypothetical protein